MTWHLSIENIAGIRRGDAQIEPGVNAVRASNWQGKSSFLAAIETVFGTAAPLTEGERSGRVVLSTESDEFTVEIEQTAGTISQSGEPYLTDEVDRVCAELFAFLDETNEVRQAVRVGNNLESFLTRPLDFENIDEQIANLQAERDQVETERKRVEAAANHLPNLQTTVTNLESKLDDLHAEWEEIGDNVTGDNAAREDLSDLRAEREQVKAGINRYESIAERVDETLEGKRDELESLEIPSREDLETDLESLHGDLREVVRDKELLQSVYEVNQRVLDEDRVALLTEIHHEMLSDTVACWLCGCESARDTIEDQLDAIAEHIDTLRNEEASLREEAEDLEAKQQAAKKAERRERDLRDRIGELESQLAEAKQNLENARTSRAALDERIDELTAEVNTTEDRATDIKSEIKYTEAELADARDDLDTAEAEASQRDILDDEYDSLTAEIAELRTRKENVKRETREAFSSALDDLLERFDVGFETARLTDTFDLVVARGGRETRLDALSEGERELLGIIAAIAGHEAFDVAGRLPIMLLDSHAGLDDTNLHHLVEYLSERVDILVLSAYPEYETFDGNELSPTDWQVVTFGSDPEEISG